MEFWMRVIIYLNYEYLRMMVEFFESMLVKLILDDLVSLSLSDGLNIFRVLGFIVVNIEG